MHLFLPMAGAEIVTGFYLMLFAVGTGEQKRRRPRLYLRRMPGCVAMYSIEELTTDFRNLDITAGDTVMLHASVLTASFICFILQNK